MISGRLRSVLQDDALIRVLAVAGLGVSGFMAAITPASDASPSGLEQEVQAPQQVVDISQQSAYDTPYAVASDTGASETIEATVEEVDHSQMQSLYGIREDCRREIYVADGANVSLAFNGDPGCDLVFLSGSPPEEKVVEDVPNDPMATGSLSLLYTEPKPDEANVLESRLFSMVDGQVQETPEDFDNRPAHFSHYVTPGIHNAKPTDPQRARAQYWEKEAVPIITPQRTDLRPGIHRVYVRSAPWVLPYQDDTARAALILVENRDGAAYETGVLTYNYDQAFGFAHPGGGITFGQWADQAPILPAAVTLQQDLMYRRDGVSPCHPAASDEKPLEMGWVPPLGCTEVIVEEEL